MEEVTQKRSEKVVLYKGSVAERIMIFEKRPINKIKKRKEDEFIKTTSERNHHFKSPNLESNYNIRGKYIPRFHFPHGNLTPTIATEKTLRLILATFDTFPNNQLSAQELPRLLKICDIPFYWRILIIRCTEQKQSGLVDRHKFVEFWKQMTVYCYDNASKFIYIVSRGQRSKQYIVPEDLEPLVQDVVDTHPGLAFLKRATEFHSKYVQTVVARIFYTVNRSWSGKITTIELRNSNLLEVLQLLEVEGDINQIMAFFSYEHFYVIYCKFWELDNDHDFLLTKRELARYANHTLSSRIVDRIFSQCLKRNNHFSKFSFENKMSYMDFVWFLLSEEDKTTPTAIEYWFRCLDIDGDGVLSMFELEFFYEEQQSRMESIGIEILSFADCMCQILDMIKPRHIEFISLGDLKRCKLASLFFDTFFNLEKFLQHEQRDPLSADHDGYVSKEVSYLQTKPCYYSKYIDATIYPFYGRIQLRMNQFQYHHQTIVGYWRKAYSRCLIGIALRRRNMKI